MCNRMLVLTVLMLALAPAAVACTGSTANTASSTATAPQTATSLPTVNEPFQIVAGEYTYENEGVTVALTWKGDGPGALKVDNGSGTDLQPPGLYAVTAADQEVRGNVAGAATIPDGGSVTLQVTFPASLKPADAGLIVMKFGDQNWGALSPVVTSEGSASPSA
jgi:hypothetical protein